MINDTKEKAKEARYILSVIMRELLAATNLFLVMQEHSKHLSEDDKKNIEVLYIFHTVNSIVLSLCKYLEFHSRYRDYLPDSCKNIADQINSEVSKLGVSEFRNKYVGHIWDNRLSRPLTATEVAKGYQNICGKNLNEFITMLNDITNENLESTIVGRIDKIRNELADKYKLGSDFYI